MDWLALLIALVLPPLLGVVWVGMFVPAATPARLAMVWGNGTLVGLLLIPVVMRALDAVGISSAFNYTAITAGLLLLLGLGLRWHRGSLASADSSMQVVRSSLAGPYRMLAGLIVALLLLRFVSLGLELLWRPLTPFDATMHWATKARVWFEHGTLLPFVENQVWLQTFSDKVFTDHHPDYPRTIPLLQFWMVSALGSWNESLMNLPWLLCYVAIGAVLFAQVRAAGGQPLTALVFSYFLLSLPLLNTHVALAGYADLFLGATYGAALMAFSNWSVSRQRWQAGLALFFVIGCLLLKNEGIYWALTFVPALAVLFLSPRQTLLLGGGGLLLLFGLLVLLPQDFVFAGHSKAFLNLHFRADAPRGIFISLFVHDSWHLLVYLLVGLLLLALLMARPLLRTRMATLIALGSALVLYLILFTYTRYAYGAIHYTAVGRITLHFMPALVFLAALLWEGVRAAYGGKAIREGVV